MKNASTEKERLFMDLYDLELDQQNMAERCGLSKDSSIEKIIERGIDSAWANNLAEALILYRERRDCVAELCELPRGSSWDEITTKASKKQETGEGKPDKPKTRKGKRIVHVKPQEHNP